MMKPLVMQGQLAEIFLKLSYTNLSLIIKLILTYCPPDYNYQNYQILMQRKSSIVKRRAKPDVKDSKESSKTLRKADRKIQAKTTSMNRSPVKGSRNKAPSPESSDSESGDEFEVELILGKKVRNDQVLYRVKWKGYDMRYCTWEPEENLSNCPKKIEAFEKSLEDESESEQAGSESEENEEEGESEEEEQSEEEEEAPKKGRGGPKGRNTTNLRKRPITELRSSRRSSTRAQGKPKEEEEDKEEVESEEEEEPEPTRNLRNRNKAVKTKMLTNEEDKVTTRSKVIVEPEEEVKTPPKRSGRGGNRRGKKVEESVIEPQKVIEEKTAVPEESKIEEEKLSAEIPAPQTKETSAIEEEPVVNNVPTQGIETKAKVS